MRLLLSYLKQHGKLIAMAMGLAAVNQIFSLLDPQIFRIIVDNYASRAFELSRQEFLSGVILLLLASVGVAFISRVAKNFQDYFVSTITQRVGANLYETSVRHSFSLPYRHFEDQSSGELLQKLQKARTDSQQLLTLFINVIFLSAVGMTFVIAYAFYVNWLVGAVYLLMIPLVGGTMFYLTRRIKATQKEIVTKGAMLAGSTTETLRNVELVKSLGLETQEIGRLNRANESILSLELEKIRLIRILSFVQGTIINGLRAAILLLMMWLIFNKAISFGEFFSLYIYTFFIFNPLQELGNVANAYQETSASMERLEQILNQKPESKPVNAITLGPLEKIEFKNVSFSYGEDNASIKNISLIIPRGQTVAFVGPSGAGKSTLIKLLVSLYQPMSGEILFNNVASNKVNIDNLRQHIGYVSQDTQLFAGTIGENLRFVKPEASEAECLAALKAAAVEKIIERGDLGLETRIGEGGLKLSGGERQRLAIARALLRKPDLIVFDEATSSLDSVTEKEITDTIKKIGKERPELTVVMIAHRLSTISHANTIYVLEKGQVVEEGTHNKLLVRSGLYAALWREQGHKN